MADTFTTWKYASQNIESYQNNGELVSSEASIILAGPPRAKNVTEIISTVLTARQADATGDLSGIEADGYSLVPIGKVRSFTCGQVIDSNAFHEVGSRKAYTIPGKWSGTGSIVCVNLFDYNLLKRLYGNKYNLTNDQYALSIPDGTNPNANTWNWQEQLVAGGDQPGSSGGLSFNALTSRLFTSHIGLCELRVSNRNRPYSALYYEDVLLRDYQSALDGDATIIMEQVSFIAGFVVPLEVSVYSTATT